MLYLGKTEPIYLYNLSSLSYWKLLVFSLFSQKAACMSFTSLGAVLQVRVFKVCEGAKPQDLAAFQLLDRGARACRWPQLQELCTHSFWMSILKSLSSLLLLFSSWVFAFCCMIITLLNLSTSVGLLILSKQGKITFAKPFKSEDVIVNPIQKAVFYPTRRGEE